MKIKNIKNICYCTDDQHYNCILDELGPVYPGQTFPVNLIFKLHKYYSEPPVIVKNIQGLNRASKSHSMADEIQLFQNVFTKMDISIQYKYNKNGKNCELYLQGSAKV